MEQINKDEHNDLLLKWQEWKDNGGIVSYTATIFCPACYTKIEIDKERKFCSFCGKGPYIIECKII